jgi:hypothetical protein
MMPRRPRLARSGKTHELRMSEMIGMKQRLLSGWRRK